MKFAIAKSNKRSGYSTIRCMMLALAILLFQYGSAQGIYEIRYNFFEKLNNGAAILGREYKALLFYNGNTNENNILRVRYYDSEDGWSVVEQKVMVEFTVLNGKNYWVLKGTNPKYISKASKGKKYNPDIIVLSKKLGDQYFQPDYVYSPTNALQQENGKISSFKIMEKKRITDKYLLDFSWEWPKENNTHNDLRSATLHLVLVTNSNDGSLGTGFLANHRKLKSLFKDVATTCNMRFNFTEVIGDDFNKNAVENTVTNVVPGSNDVIVFYYSGHGFRFADQTSVWPRIDLRDGISQNISTSNSLNLDFDVYQPLAKKGARLTIVIGECCNTSVGGTPSRSDPVIMSPGQNMLSAASVKALFNKEGNILVATSSPGQPSWYYVASGGYFCNSLLDNFLTDVGFTGSGNNLSWNKIFDDAIRDTETKVSFDNRKQVPLSYIKIK